MIPVLFEWGPLKIHSFGFMLAVTFLLMAALATREFRRRGYTADAAGSVVLGAMLGGVLGAKVYYLIDHWSSTMADPVGMVFSGAGLTFYGGLVGGTLGVLLAGRRHKVPLFHLLDLTAPLLALGYATGRIGCFLNGDDYGRVSDAPWAMAFPEGTPPTTLRVHPTQIYEVAASLLIFLVLWMSRRRWERRPGRVMGIYGILGGLERFAVEFYRTNEPVAAGLTLAQWTSFGVILIGIGLLAASASRVAAGVRDSRAA